MHDVRVVTGTLTDPRTIILDENLTGTSGKVRLTVEPIMPNQPRPTLKEFLDELRREHAARGHRPRTAEEIEAYIRVERASWGD